MLLVENPPESKAVFKSMAFPSMIQTIPRVLLIFKRGEIIQFRQTHDLILHNALGYPWLSLQHMGMLPKREIAQAHFLPKAGLFKLDGLAPLSFWPLPQR